MKVTHQNDVGHSAGTVRFQQLSVVCCKRILRIHVL